MPPLPPGEVGRNAGAISLAAWGEVTRPWSSSPSKGTNAASHSGVQREVSYLADIVVALLWEKPPATRQKLESHKIVHKNIVHKKRNTP